jgi:potassium/hydrogen antiporter
MAVLLTVTFVSLIQGSSHIGPGLLGSLVVQLVLGAALGFVLGHLTIWVINRSRLEWEGLYPVLSIAIALFIYAVSSELHGNGFLAVYVAGIVAGNRTLLHKQTLRVFNDGVAWLMQISMFLVLGLQVFPSRMKPIALPALGIALVLTLVIRPVSVFVALAFTRMGWREKLMISWSGLRGAAPIVLATFPLLARLDKADVIFHIVFFVVLVSLLLQGTTLPRVARLLGVESQHAEKRKFPLTFNATSTTGSGLQEIEIAPGSSAEGKRLVDLALPKGVLLVLLNRDDQFIVPGGSTILKAGDRTLLLATPAQLEELRPLLGSKERKDA